MNNDRVYHQTTEEWLAEYETGVVKPAIGTRSQMCNLVLTFDHHRTAKAMSGIVILSFIDMASREEYVSFFNADLTWQRGSRKGRQKTTGLGAPFYLPERGNFENVAKNIKYRATKMVDCPQRTEESFEGIAVYWLD